MAIYSFDIPLYAPRRGGAKGGFKFALIARAFAQLREAEVGSED